MAVTEHPIKKQGWIAGLRDKFFGAFGDTQWSAASQDRELRRWNPHAGSADADNMWEVDTVRSRARDLDRNESLASGFLDSTTTGVNGQGLRYTPTPSYRLLGKDKKWADQWSRGVRDLIREALTSTDVDITRDDNAGGVAALAFRNFQMSGSVLVVFKWKKDRNRRWKSCIHLVEADRISNPNYVLDTITCRGGHQLDEDGETLGFWVRRQHPGDIIAIPQLPIWDYVPRKTTWGRTQSVLLARKDRIDQHYFLSALATVVPEFKVLGDYKKAELQATLANAIVAMVIESSAQFGDIAELFEGPADYMSKRGEWNNKVKKQGLGFGATIPLMPGDKMSSYNPGRPNEKAVEFLKWATRHIATGLGVPAETITHDWSELNYSSARTVILDAMRAYNQFRAVLVDRFYQPLLENLFEEAVWAGKIPDCTPTEFYQNKAAWTKSRWSGPGKGWVDPDKEAKAAKGRLETGLTTLEIECDDQGYDWLDIADQRAAERDYYRSHGMAYAPEMAAENVTTRATVDETAVQIEDDKDPPNDPSQD